MDKAKKLKELLDILNDGVSKKDLKEFFESAMKHILTLEKKVIEKNNKELEALKELFNKFQTSKGVDLDKLKLEAKQFTDKLFKEQTSNLNFLQDKARSLKNGKDGKKGEKGERGEKGDSKDGSPDTSEEIRNKLETLEGDEKLEISAIKDLQDKLDELKKMKLAGASGGGSASGGKIVKVYDLSASLNGVLKTFSLPAFWRVIDVKLSSIPVLRPTTDYTIDGSLFKITFTSEVQAGTDLSTGQSCIIIYAEA